MMNQNIQHPLNQSFVIPSLCARLVEAGLVVQTCFSWKCNKLDNTSMLQTYSFDPDRYYQQADINTSFVHSDPDIFFIPAFQGNDLEKIIPDYLLTRADGLYTVCLNTYYQMNVCTDKRMPDAFARMALECFAKRVIDVQMAINSLTVKTTNQA